MTVATKKAVSKKTAKTAVSKKTAKTAEAVTQKNISNTQRCANLILQFAREAKHTRNEIVASVSDALSALSIVTVKTMMSDLQNSKYAKRYSTHTIAVDKTTKIVTVASEIKA